MFLKLDTSMLFFSAFVENVYLKKKTSLKSDILSCRTRDNPVAFVAGGWINLQFQMRWMLLCIIVPGGMKLIKTACRY